MVHILKEKKEGMAGVPMTMTTFLLINPVELMGYPADAFTAYDCTNRSNIVESYSLLEPDTCAAMNGNRELR
jgi:hypothetical protein